MSTEALTVVGLLQKGEEEFDSLIKVMYIKSLMDVISGLQREMAKEQESFNSLSGELQNRKEKNSRQSKQISKDMVTSQQRLTLLMNRSMKCFAQQNQSVSKGAQLKRRNSAKGSQPVIAPVDKSTNIHRSRSMHSVNQSDDLAPISTSNPSALSVRKPLTPSTTSHTPVIMKPSMNGGVVLSAGARKSKPNSQTSLSNGASGGRMTNGKAVSSSTGGSNVSSAVSTSLSASSTTTTTTTVSSSEAGGGIYTKRKQTPKVLTTLSATPYTILSSANAFTATLPPKVPSSTPISQASSSSYSSSSSHSPFISSSSSPSGRIQILETKQRPSSTTFFTPSNPLLMAKARPGLSKSQIICQSESDELRGLPSVKLLAQTFGSNTALHKASTNTSSSNAAGRSSPAKAVSRSSSSVCFGQSKTHVSSNRIFLTKAKPDENPASVLNATIMNGGGKILQHPQQLHQDDRPSGKEELNIRNNSINGSLSDLEMARARLKRNDNSSDHLSKSPIETSTSSQEGITPDISSSNVIVSPSNADGIASTQSHINSTNDDKPKETVRAGAGAGAYVKKSGVQGVKGQYKTNTSPAAATNAPLSSSTSTTSASKPSSSPSTQSSSKVTSSAAPPNSGYMRRSKSREELQQTKTTPDRPSLLKQIEARRTDQDNRDTNGSNFQSMAKLSRSMPSLLAAGKAHISSSTCQSL